MLSKKSCEINESDNWNLFIAKKMWNGNLFFTGNQMRLAVGVLENILWNWSCGIMLVRKQSKIKMISGLDGKWNFFGLFIKKIYRI